MLVPLETRHAVVVVVMCLLCWTTAAQDVAPVTLAAGLAPGEHCYQVRLHVGTPPTAVDFEVAFASHVLAVYGDLGARSVSYAADGGGSDLLYVGSGHRRLPLRADVDGQLRARYARCALAGGLLGLGRGSAFWQAWPQASFTAASLTAGGMNPLLASGGRAHASCHVRCSEGATSAAGVACSTHGTLVGAGGDDDRVVRRVHLALDGADTRVPLDVYDRYMRDKNVYADDAAATWEPLHVVIPHASDAECGHAPPPPPSAAAPAIGALRVALHADVLIRQLGKGTRALLLRPNADANDTSVTLGGPTLWSAFVFHRRAGGTCMLVQQHAVHQHLGWVGLLLHAALFSLLVRWKLVYTARAEPYERTDADERMLVAQQVLGPALALAAVLLPLARDALADFPVLFALSLAIYAASTVLTAVLTVVDVMVRRQWRASGRRVSPYATYRVMFARALAYETVLMIGLWAAAVPRRTEGVGTALTAVSAFYSVYNVSMHALMFAVFTAFAGRAAWMTRRSRWPSLLWLVVLVVEVPLLVGFAAFAGFVYFTQPLLVRNALIHAEVAVPTLVVLYLFALTLAAFMAGIYVRTAVAAVAADAIKEHDKKQRNTGKTARGHPRPLALTAAAAAAAADEGGTASSKNDASADADDDGGILRLLGRGLAVISGLVSSFVLSMLDVTVEVWLSAVFIVLLWAAVYNDVLRLLRSLRFLRRNKLWRDVLLQVLEFSLLLGIFLVLQLLLRFLGDLVRGASLSNLEIVIGIYELMIAGFALVMTVKAKGRV